MSPQYSKIVAKLVKMTDGSYPSYEALQDAKNLSVVLKDPILPLHGEASRISPLQRKLLLELLQSLSLEEWNTWHLERERLHDEALLIVQLEEWVLLEEELDEYPMDVVIDPFEMNDEMDVFQDERDQKEELLATQSRSHLPGGEYLVPSEQWNRVRQGNIVDDFSMFCGSVWLPESRPMMLPPGVMQPSRQLVAGDKMIVEASTIRNGKNFHTGECSSGKIYIDLKFTSHIPAIGEKVLMIVRLKEVNRSMEWKCVKVIKKEVM
jgi:hypothetical protein